MNKTTGKDMIKSLFQDLKNLTTKMQKDSENKTKVINDFSWIINTTKKEYQNVINKTKDIQKEKED